MAPSTYDFLLQFGSICNELGILRDRNEALYSTYVKKTRHTGGYNQTCSSSIVSVGQRTVARNLLLPRTENRKDNTSMTVATTKTNATATRYEQRIDFVKIGMPVNEYYVLLG